MKTSSAKAKGRRLCQAIKEKLHAWAPDLREGDIEITSSGAPGEDLKLSPAARDVYPISIEAKNCEQTKPWEWYKQAQENAGSHVPVVVFSRNRAPEPLVIMSLENLLKLIR